MRARAEERLHRPDPAALNPGHLALIEAIYRVLHVMATFWREEMLDPGREEELDELVVEGRDDRLTTI